MLPPRGKGAEPVGRRNPAIVQGLVNLVENAVDFADARVTVGTEWTDGEVAITIADDGPGFSPRSSTGSASPTSPRAATARRAAEPHHEAGGLGLGLFIAKTLLERSGAVLDLANRAPPEKGAVVRVVWPRAFMDMGLSATDTEAETIG